ncbi:MAG: hypothetical protein IBJ11_10200 [Phycisphaerales bacterium]|nr:hypothetical protein [Phycisphaerales bacterium]
MNHRRVLRPSVLLACAGVSAALAVLGCSNVPTSARNDRTPSKPISQLPAEPAPAVAAETAAADGGGLNSARSGSAESPGAAAGSQQGWPKPAPAAPPAAAAAPASPANVPASVESGAGEPAAASAASGSNQPPAPAPAPEDPAAQRSRLVSELAANIQGELSRSASPVGPLARLAALELFQPGVAGAGVSAAGNLSDREKRFLGAWRDMFASAHANLSSTPDVQALAASARSLGEASGSVAALALPRTLLCTRVEGFGVYNELRTFTGAARYKLLAGQTHKVIVYTEVENFSHREAGGEGGRYAVELAQALSLYHTAGSTDTLAWRAAEQPIDDLSRNRRRDFFAVQIIELPASISVGSYSLKVAVRDRHGGAVAESVIPIEFVADSSALSAVGP